jgi:hypothetical protein
VFRRDLPSAVLKLPWGINKDCPEAATANKMPRSPQLCHRSEYVSRWPLPRLEALGCMKMMSAKLSFDYHLRDEKRNPFRVCK